MDWSFSKEFRDPLFMFSMETKTVEEQNKMEDLLNDTYYNKKEIFGNDYKRLFKIIHIKFSKMNLFNLPQSYESLDASQTWIAYWSLHSLKLLGFVIPDEWKFSIIKDLESCQNICGGFGGGPYQISHLATTYGAVVALIELEHIEAISIINRKMLQEWLLQIKTENGAFSMHEGGELDVRGCYCAITVAKLCKLDCALLFNKTPEWLASCQTYEGGFGGAPGLEAHGGYTFCALAALIQLDKVELIDLNMLLKWTVSRQMSCEGGFQGRTNKLVDSCYSYWVGAILPLIHQCFVLKGVEIADPIFDINALQDYILVCCQRLTPPIHDPSGGGIIDKPGKQPDPYHTCYALSGLATTQQYAKRLQTESNFQSSLSVADDLESNNLTYNVTLSAYKFHCNNFLLKEESIEA